MTSSLDQYATTKLEELESRKLRRAFATTDRSEGIWIRRNGRQLLSFSCNDYLNLTQHPFVKEAAIEAIRTFGVGAGASRLVTGNHPLFAELESRLARLKGTEAACVFGSGYLANTGIVPALVNADDLILLDELVHGCLWTGARLARGKVFAFRHNDVDHAEALLAGHRAHHPHALILTDAVFSQDGDLAPLESLLAVARRYDAWLMSDDAHGVGVIGMPDPATPIVPLIIGNDEAAVEASRLLEEEGFFVQAIRPPAVPPGTARLRVIFTAGHQDADIERLAEAVQTKIFRGRIRARLNAPS